MSDRPRTVEDHYTTNDLEKRIMAELALKGVITNSLTVDESGHLSFWL